jgi:MFS family permease
MSPRELRMLVVVVGAVVFVDTMFYAVVAPMLPTLTRQLHMSKTSAGLLTAGYPVGTLIGSLPAGFLAARVGPRPTLYAGLLLLATSSLAFGFLDNVAALDGARFVQGVGGACTWSAGLAWLIAETPASSRGGLIGTALAAAIGGALFGPVLGSLAEAVGRGPVFVFVALIGLALIVWASTLRSRHRPSQERLGDLLAAVRRPRILLGMWLVTVPAVASGLLNVLAPLRLSRFGAGAAAIGATFLVASALEAAISPSVGRVSDRRGRIVPLRFGLAGATIALLCFTLPGDALVLAVVIVATEVVLGAFWAPAMALLSDMADADGLSQGLAVALINVAWAGGQVIGSGGGGALAKRAGDGVPFLIVVALCAVTLVPLVLRRSPLGAGAPLVAPAVARPGPPVG